VSAPTHDLGRLHGGLRLPAFKEASTTRPVAQCPVPGELVIPLRRSADVEAIPTVKAGDKVLGGQVIARDADRRGAAIHAPSSGQVTAIEPRPVFRRLGDNDTCIIIRTDGEDRFASAEAVAPYQELSPDALIESLADGGIAGLGGAVFPTAEKISRARHGYPECLIVNGVECEPYISCDDMLMRDQPEKIVQGTQILLHILGTGRAIIAVESDKPGSLKSLNAAIQAAGDDRLKLRQIPSIYPSGAEDQLVQLVSGVEVPAGGLPSDVGHVVQNVATVAAIADWIVDARPLVERITTVTGDGVSQPVNVRARIGTPVSELVACAGGYTDRARHLVIGGAMTGKAMSNDAIPVEKATNCVAVLAAVPEPGPELRCIRCGECAVVCPVELLPQQLHWYGEARNPDQLERHGLRDCMECGCCDLVCPSLIPLTRRFRAYKEFVSRLEQEQARATHARQRFDARSARLQREQDQRERELAEQKSAARDAGPAAIEAILARARRKAGDGEEGN
jgi:electron transport complex protein RnfC